SSTYDADPSYYIPDFNIFKGTVVRARAYKVGALTSGIVTQTYFVSPEGGSRFEIPVISLSVDENKFFEYNNGIYVAGADFDNWRIENPDTPALFNADANYDRSGETTEQIGHFNYFVNGNEVLNQRVGIRINGGGTRAFQHKSLRLYARSELGASTFNYPIFANENYTSYKRLVLRNSGNDFFNTYYKDAFTHELIEKTGLDNQAYLPSVVFLNGEYWGMLNIRERLDRHYFERKYGIVEADIEILADGYVIDEGSDAHFQAMYSYFQNNSLVDDANLSYINTQMDVDNFRDYFITNIFIQNTDWPGWNTLFWRKKTAAYEPGAPYGNDGRWRTAIKDTDAGFSLMLDINDHNTLEFATALGGPIWPNP
ncbi:MAG: spore coat protein CotH, partial [Bacteroidetes bacterium HGW-Bacteroidetes-23]